MQLIPANRPSLSVARWRVSSHSDDIDLEIFEGSEALVEPGLLEAIVLSVVLLRSGRAFERAFEIDTFGMGTLHLTLGMAGAAHWKRIRE